MAFKDLGEALEELGYSGTWTEQTGQMSIDLEYIRASGRARSVAFRQRHRAPARAPRAPTCHPALVHKGHGLCSPCYNAQPHVIERNRNSLKASRERQKAA